MVAVVVPWRPGCPHRERGWQWLRGAYAATHPDWDVVEAQAPSGPWIKALAVAPAIEASEAEIIIQADADCFTDGLLDAVQAVEDGAGWAVPHLKVHRLSEEGTEAVYTGKDWRGQKLMQRPYQGFLGGGIVVARREVFEAAPLDRRFISWGSEDEAHAFALRCLFGKPWRGSAGLVHLFHPPQERETRRWGSRESWALRRRYFDARRDPAAMCALLEEARCLPTE